MMNYAETAIRIVSRGRPANLQPEEVGVEHDGKVYVYETPSDREDFRRWAESAWMEEFRWADAKSLWLGDMLWVEAWEEGCEWMDMLNPEPHNDLGPGAHFVCIFTDKDRARDYRKLLSKERRQGAINSGVRHKVTERRIKVDGAVVTVYCVTERRVSREVSDG